MRSESASPPRGSTERISGESTSAPLVAEASSSDRILIRSLAVSTRIGVTDAERAFPQRLLVDLEITPLTPFQEMQDRLPTTVDYAAVCQDILALCARREGNLLESLAVECVQHILTQHPARHVLVRLRKFVLPETEYVAVEHAAWRSPQPSAQVV